MTLGQIIEAFTLPHYAEKYPDLPSKEKLEQFLDYRNGMVFVREVPKLLPIPSIGEGVYYLDDSEFSREWAKVMFSFRNGKLIRKYDKKVLRSKQVVGYHPRQQVAYLGDREKIVSMLTQNHAEKYIRQHLVTKDILNERFIFEKFRQDAPDDYMTPATHLIREKETGKPYQSKRNVKGVFLTPDNIYKIMNGFRLKEIKARKKNA